MHNIKIIDLFAIPFQARIARRISTTVSRRPVTEASALTARMNLYATARRDSPVISARLKSTNANRILANTKATARISSMGISADVARARAGPIVRSTSTSVIAIPVEMELNVLTELIGTFLLSFFIYIKHIIFNKV